jgi:predicted metal-dependent phosphoesterase TrpH
MLKIDLHVHTWYSDARSTVLDVLEMAKRRGLDGIAITDHHTMQGVWDAEVQVDDFLIVPGIEITTRDGHLLGLGLRDNKFTLYKSRNRSALEISRMIREIGGVVVVPHPCTPFFSMRRSVIERISPDAIEVYNAHSPCFARDARRSRKLAEQLKIPCVAGSDSHTWQTVGDAYTLIDATPDIDAVLHAIRSGHTSIVGSASPWKYRLPIFTWLTSRRSHEMMQHRRRVLTPSFSSKREVANV